MTYYPPGFDDWPLERRNEYFAKEARAHERKARPKPNGGAPKAKAAPTEDGAALDFAEH
jgi:hypothetical protein